MFSHYTLKIETKDGIYYLIASKFCRVHAKTKKLSIKDSRPVLYNKCQS